MGTASGHIRLRFEDHIPFYRCMFCPISEREKNSGVNYQEGSYILWHQNVPVQTKFTKVAKHGKETIKTTEFTNII